MPHSTETSAEAVSQAQLEAAIRTLEAVVQDRASLLALDNGQQIRLLRAAGLVAHPGRAAKRQMVRAARDLRRRDRVQRRERDEQLCEQTGIRRGQASPRLTAAPPHPTSESVPLQAPSVPLISEDFIGGLEEPRNCYICKQDFSRLHFFYDSLCPRCAAFNWVKRNQTCDLTGRYALVTGGRVKIGFEAVLKLLRAGANVVVTTRFPVDAARRFESQDDSSCWLNRLRVFGLDMRHTPSVEHLADHLAAILPQLDFILNNACQTVRRPPGFYKHLMQTEQLDASKLSNEVQQVLADYRGFQAQANVNGDQESNSVARLLDAKAALGIHAAAQLTQLSLMPEDLLETSEELFPQGQLDHDLQQVDLRGRNSWRLRLAEVGTIEFLEVQLVNAVAPFILNARLKPLMLKTSSRDKHIVNVSAMEGVFYRAFKRDTHPHTNMAKAALNMMTRTSAADYVRDGIYMNSVDTGWITDEDPQEITKRKQQERGFRTPLDCVDAAARICDPIFNGLTSGQHVWGKFLKDYQVANW